MKCGNLFSLAVLFFCLVGCMSPSRETVKEVYERIESTTNSLQKMHTANLKTNFRIWYLGSDDSRHYFGEYKPTVQIFPFTNNIHYVYLLKSEMSIEPEQNLHERLGSGTNVSDQKRQFWRVPTSVRVDKDVLDNALLKEYLVLAKLLPAENM